MNPRRLYRVQTVTYLEYCTVIQQGMPWSPVYAYGLPHWSTEYRPASTHGPLPSVQSMCLSVVQVPKKWMKRMISYLPYAGFGAFDYLRVSITWLRGKERSGEGETLDIVNPHPSHQRIYSDACSGQSPSRRKVSRVWLASPSWTTWVFVARLSQLGTPQSG
jgi:hypothetical protein